MSFSTTAQKPLVAKHSSLQFENSEMCALMGTMFQQGLVIGKSLLYKLHKCRC